MSDINKIEKKRRKMDEMNKLVIHVVCMSHISTYDYYIPYKGDIKKRLNELLHRLSYPMFG